MTKQPPNLTQRSLRFLIANDSYAMGFQTVGQYRSTLLQIIDGINREPQAGIVEIVAAGAPPMPGIDLSGLVRYDFVGLEGGGEQLVQVDTAGYYIAHEVETLVALANQPAPTVPARDALRKINDIRNSIIGLQSLNWSEHVYPLVAALDEAGYEGMDYPEARKNYGTLLARAVKAEDALAALAHQSAQEQAGITLDEALYALDLVVNKMNEPGLSGQRAFALDVLKRAAQQEPVAAPQQATAPTHCDPAEGFCKACRERDRAAQLDGQGEREPS